MYGWFFGSFFFKMFNINKIHANRVSQDFYNCARWRYNVIVAFSVKISRKDNSEIVNKNILITIFLYFTHNHYSNGGILFPHFLSFRLSSTTSLINYLSFLLFLFCILPPITLHNLFFFYFPLWSQFLSSYSSLPVLNRADKLPGPFLANEGKSKS